MLKINETRANVERIARTRSTWGRAVLSDALEMLDNLETERADDVETVADLESLELALLNGAADNTLRRFGKLAGHRFEAWVEYSFSGSALCYCGDIAAHYFTPSEFAKWDRRSDSTTAPGGEDLLRVQARALFQAANLIRRAAVFC